MGISYNLYVNVFSRAEDYPERVAFRTIGKSLTYGQLQARVLQAAIAFRENGIDARACVVLDARTSLPSLTAALAFALIGCKWVFSSGAALNNPLLFITHLVQDGPHAQASRYKTITMDETWHDRNIPESNLTQTSFAGRVEPERILVIGQSSGTTGEPKFFPITAENAIRRTNPKYLLDPSPLPVVASMFHVLHAGIYFVLLRTLAKGGTIVFGLDKARWREAGITLLLASPMHLSQVFEWRGDKDSRKFPRVWLAGSPVYPAFLNQALNHFEEVLNAYGASEASIVSHQVFTRRASEDEIISVGKAEDDVRLEVVDEHGIAVGTGEVGEVRYQSPLLTSGYIGDSETTRACFRNGWFHPGDTGYLNGQNQLFIVGRVNDLLNLGGTKLNAAAVDSVIQSAPNVTDGACFTETGTSGFEQLSVVVVPLSNAGREKIVGDLLKKLSSRFARALLPHSVYIAEIIPRNENGKVLRGAARQKAQSGAWPKVTPEKE